MSIMVPLSTRQPADFAPPEPPEKEEEEEAVAGHFAEQEQPEAPATNVTQGWRSILFATNSRRLTKESAREIEAIVVAVKSAGGPTLRN